jgi:hypothetical protein
MSATICAAVATCANAPFSAAMNAACTSAAGTIVLPKVSVRVAQASCASVQRNPRSAAARVDVSMHICGIIPAITNESISAARKCPSSGVSRNAFG